MWLYPDGTRILELSTKCAPGEALQVAGETKAFLTGLGVDLGRRPADQDADGTRALRRLARSERHVTGRPEALPWWGPVVAGAASAIAGIAVIVWPDITLLALALIAGINLVLLSALLVGETIGSDDGGDRTMKIVVGVLGIVAGLIVIRRPGETLLVVILAVGIWLVLTGILELLRGILVAGPHRLLRILGGAVDVIIGILVLSLPKLSLATVAALIGIGFIIHGLVLVVGGWRLRGSAQVVGAASVPS